MIRSNGFHFDIIESYDEINIYITNSSQDTIISNLSFKNLDRYPFFFYNFNFQTSIFIHPYLSFHLLDEILSHFYIQPLGK